MKLYHSASSQPIASRAPMPAISRPSAHGGEIRGAQQQDADAAAQQEPVDEVVGVVPPDTRVVEVERVAGDVDQERRHDQREAEPRQRRCVAAAPAHSAQTPGPRPSSADRRPAASRSPCPRTAAGPRRRTSPQGVAARWRPRSATVTHIHGSRPRRLGLRGVWSRSRRLHVGGCAGSGQAKTPAFRVGGRLRWAECSPEYRRTCACNGRLLRSMTRVAPHFSTSR